MTLLLSAPSRVKQLSRKPLKVTIKTLLENCSRDSNQSTDLDRILKSYMVSEMQKCSFAGLKRVISEYRKPLGFSMFF